MIGLIQIGSKNGKDWLAETNDDMNQYIGYGRRLRIYEYTKH